MTAVATTATSDAGDDDDEPGPPPAVRDRVPDPEHRHHEADLLLRQARRAGAEREGQQAVLVEEPDRAEQERRRERDRVEVVDDEPLRRRIEEVDEREAEARPLAAEVLAGEEEDRHRAERDGDGLRRRGAGRGSARATRAGRRAATSGSKCAPSREIWCALEVGHLEEAPVRGRPDGLREVADVEAARLEGALLEHRERRHPGGEGAHRQREQRPRPGHAAAIARSSSARQRAAEHGLARACLVRLAARRADPVGEAGSDGEPPHGRGERLRDRPAGRAARRRRRSAARARPGVSAVTSGVPQAIVWNALFGITRPALAPVPKMPSAQPADWISPGRSSYSTQGIHSTFGGRSSQERLELPAPDDAERDLGCERGGGEDRVEAVERDQLADEEHVKRRLRLPAGEEEAVLGSDEADLDALGGKAELLAEERARAPRCRRRRHRHGETPSGRRGGRRRRPVTRAGSGRGRRRACRRGTRAD